MGDSRYTASEAERLQKNRDALCSVVAGTAAPRRPEDRRTLGLELERVVIDPASGTRIAFDDVLGLSTLLEHWSRFFGADERVVVDGRLFGYAGTVDVGCGRTVGITVSLEPGGQLEASVGPSESVVDLLGALEAFDEQWVALCDELGVEWQLVALGCDPLTADPQEVPLIPKERYRLMDAYLSRTGRYARDMMRLSASTQVSIDCGAQDSVVEQFRLAVALGPIISFLCDNVSSWRGLSPEDTPSMVRSRIWESVDADRCGVVPGTFEDGFSSERYVDWLLGVRPILFTDDHGLTIATCSATEADILAMRDLSSGELAHMLSMVFPTVRLKGIIEMRDADSMPPRLACALAASSRASSMTRRRSSRRAACWSKAAPMRKWPWPTGSFESAAGTPRYTARRLPPLFSGSSSLPRTACPTPTSAASSTAFPACGSRASSLATSTVKARTKVPDRLDLS